MKGKEGKEITARLSALCMGYIWLVLVVCHSFVSWLFVADQLQPTGACLWRAEAKVAHSPWRAHFIVIVVSFSVPTGDVFLPKE